MKLKKHTKINKQLDKLQALTVMMHYNFTNNEGAIKEILEIRDKISKIAME
jgi:DNA-binding FadR family transcriptional regulator